MTAWGRADGWRKCGPVRALVRDGMVRQIVTEDGRPAEFYRYTRRCGGDGWERWPIPPEGISWICAYRRLQARTWEVRA